MRFTLPFLLGLAAFTATVFGANATSFTGSDEMSFDILSAASALAFRLENIVRLHQDVALAVGALLLCTPALFAFHIARLLFGGSAQRLRAEGRSGNVEDRQSRIQLLLDEDERMRGAGNGAIASASVFAGASAASARNQPENAFSSSSQGWNDAETTGSEPISSGRPLPRDPKSLASARSASDSSSYWSSGGSSSGKESSASGGGSLSERLQADDDGGATRGSDILGSESSGAKLSSTRAKLSELQRSNWQALSKRASSLGAGLKKMRRPEGGDA